MNTLVAVAIAPFGVGDELAPEVAEVVRVVRDATFVLAQKGIRTEVILKADVRPGFENMMEQKVRSVDAILEGGVADGDAEKGE